MDKPKFEDAENSSSAKNDDQSKLDNSASNRFLRRAEARAFRRNQTQEQRAKAESQRKIATGNSCLELFKGLFTRRSKIDLDKNDTSNMEKSQPKSVAAQLQSVTSFTDSQLFDMLDARVISLNKLEQFTANKNKAINLRREYISKDGDKVEHALLEFPNIKENRVKNLKITNLIGFIPIPLGVAGPFLVDGCRYFVPMATSTKDLVATVGQGMAACVLGVKTHLIDDVLSFCVVVVMPNVGWAVGLLECLKAKGNFRKIKKFFDSGSSFLSLLDIKIKPLGNNCLIRFIATAGDAVNGKQLMEKGAKIAIQHIQQHFPLMTILAVGENEAQFKELFPFSMSICNYEEVHGKSVVAEALIPAEHLKKTLEMRSILLVEVNAARDDMKTSACGEAFKTGMIATKVVEAVFMATGQDAALIPSSSNCSVSLECAGVGGEDLYVTVTMPSIQVGTENGATKLTTQKSALQFLQVAGRNPEIPGKNSITFARIICASVLAAELGAITRFAQIHIENDQKLLDPTDGMNPTIH